MRVILTCFSYQFCRTYEFDPSYLRSDIVRIVNYLVCSLGVDPDEIVILTDLEVYRREYKSIYTEYLKYLIEAFGKLPDDVSSPRKGDCHNLVVKYSNHLNRPYSEISNFIKENIAPVFTHKNVIEFLYLFGEYHRVYSKRDYTTYLKKAIKSTTDDQVFMYWSCHGVKSHNGVQKYGILTPRCGGGVSLTTSPTLTKIIEGLPKETEVVCLVDCCYSQEMIQVAYRFCTLASTFLREIVPKNFPNILVLASSTHEELSGFFSRDDEKGSLFTKYAIEYFVSHDSVVFKEFVEDISLKISNYRRSIGRAPQNVCVLSSRRDTEQLVKWFLPKHV